MKVYIVSEHIQSLGIDYAHSVQFTTDSLVELGVSGNNRISMIIINTFTTAACRLGLQS